MQSRQSMNRLMLHSSAEEAAVEVTADPETMGIVLLTEANVMVGLDEVFPKLSDSGVIDLFSSLYNIDDRGGYGDRSGGFSRGGGRDDN